MNTFKNIGSGLLGLVLGGILIWAHMSDLVELCRSEAASVQAELHEMQGEHRAMAERLGKAEQERTQAYDELGRILGAKVDLTIPFKPVSVELSSLPGAACLPGQTWSSGITSGCQHKVHIETNEITALAKFGTKIEDKLKQGFLKLATGVRP